MVTFTPLRRSSEYSLPGEGCSLPSRSDVANTSAGTDNTMKSPGVLWWQKPGSLRKSRQSSAIHKAAGFASMTFREYARTLMARGGRPAPLAYFVRRSWPDRAMVLEAGSVSGLSDEHPLVSVIVPTKNSEPFIRRCLESVRAQTYTNLELIVVDNSSTDRTQPIAHDFTPNVYTCGPERSAQLNYGVERARGRYVYKVDSDFLLDRQVVEQCVERACEGYDAIVVHNSPDASVSWIAKVRKFEVDMYKYDLTHSSARFVSKAAYKAIGGFNESITAGEDYDFQNRLNRGGFRTGFVSAEALHLGEPTSLRKHLTKYFVYGQDFVNFRSSNKKESKAQLRFLRPAYFRHWQQFVRHPLLAAAFALYALLKFAFGAAGLLDFTFKTRVRAS